MMTEFYYPHFVTRGSSKCCSHQIKVVDIESWLTDHSTLMGRHLRSHTRWTSFSQKGRYCPEMSCFTPWGIIDPSTSHQPPCRMILQGSFPTDDPGRMNQARDQIPHVNSLTPSPVSSMLMTWQSGVCQVSFYSLTLPHYDRFFEGQSSALMPHCKHFNTYHA